MSNFSVVFNLSNEPKLKQTLKNDGFVISEAQNALWRAKGNNLTVTLYKSGKILVQGKDSEVFASKYLGAKADFPSEPAESSQLVPSDWKSWIGTDESGKGDYFGPLVVAGVLVDQENISRLTSLGVQDSKKIKDSVIEKLANKIKSMCIFSVVTINPEKYNQLYPKFNNLNNFLAWGHARVIENILEKKECKNVISDKFGNESLIQNALLKKGKNINLVQKIKAESDIAVAAASILARNEFIQRIKNISVEYGIEFNKGASSIVENQAMQFIQKHGLSSLSKIAKIHFKTTDKLYMIMHK